LPCLSGSDRIRNKCRSRAGNTDTLEESCQKDREVDHGESNQVQKAQENEARSGIPQTEGSQGFRPEENGKAEAGAQNSGPQGLVGPQVRRQAQAGRKGSQEDHCCKARREAGCGCGSKARPKARRRSEACCAADAAAPCGAASDGATGSATAAATASAPCNGTASAARDAADCRPGGSYPAAAGPGSAAAATVSNAIDSVAIAIALWRAFLWGRGQRRQRRFWRRTWRHVSA
jgi:hypothetical protein